MSHTLDWWLSSLSDVRKEGESYKARCPAHDDRVGSLSITPDGSGGALVNCFAGCEYAEIVRAAEGHPVETNEAHNKHKRSTVTISGGRDLKKDPAEWWEEYTGVSKEKWRSWGVEFTLSSVDFTWKGTQSKKRRAVGTKDFTWEPEGFPRPPLWPTPGMVLPETTWITEGESDCGVLRNLGFEALAVTKGAAFKKMQGIWAELKRRGAQQIAIVFDIDPTGLQGAEDLAAQIAAEGLIPLKIDLRLVLDLFLGEKDVRDFWLRLHDEDECRQALIGLIPAARPMLVRNRVRAEEFLTLPISPETWLVDKVWLGGAAGMIVGAPKMGKSWLALDLALSVASGGKFLDMYDVHRSGPVVLITKEDPDYLLQDRLQKIFVAKGLGGRFTLPSLALPRDLGIPLFLDLSRDFLFTPGGVDDLMVWLEEIRERCGGISLVIFDPILKMLSGIDEFKASEVNTAVFGAISKIQMEFRSAVALVHHRSKAGQDAKASYGSIAFHAFSENTLYLQGDQPDKDGWVNVVGEYKSALSRIWSYRFPTLEERYEVEVSEEAKAKGSLIVLTTEIEELLKSIPEGLLVPQLVAAFDGANDGLVRKALRELEDKGRVHREKTMDGSSKGGPKKEKWFYGPEA